MRTIIAFGAALFITAILFLLMQDLIRGHAPIVDDGTEPPPEVALVDPPPEEPEPSDDPVDPPIPKPTPEDLTTELTIVLPPEDVTIEYPAPTRGGAIPIKTSVSTVGEGDPVPIAVFPPRYPQQQLIAGGEGWVRIAFTIDVDGAVRDASVIEASPRRGLFDASALSAIQRWRFAPRRDENGEPVASRAAYTIEFKLDDGV